MCTQKTIKEIDEGKAMVLKKWQLLLSVFVLSLTLMGNLVLIVTWKTTIDLIQLDHEKRISALEEKVDENREAWHEVTINLKSICSAMGIQYQTGD